MNILNLCLSYSGMKYDTLPFLGERLPRKKLDFIWSRLSLSSKYISDCDMCYLFHTENLVSS